MAQQALDLSKLAEELYSQSLNDLEQSLDMQPTPEMAAALSAASILVTNLSNYITSINQSIKQESITTTIAQMESQLRSEYFDMRKNKMYADVQYQRTMDRLHDLENQIYKNLFQFQNSINAILGQQVHMIMVYADSRTGEVKIFEHDDNITMDDLTWNRTRGKLSIDWENAEQRYKQLDMQAAINDTAIKALESLQTTYSEVRRRANISRRKIHASNGRILILWKIVGQNWDGNWVGGFGDLAESYASFYMNSYLGSRILQFSNNLENAVSEFMRDTVSGVENVDSTSGLLQGDFTIGGNEYAVKSQIGQGNDYNRASPLQWKQIVDLAEWMLAHPTLITKEFFLKLKQRLEERGSKNKHSGRLTDLLNGTAEASFNDVMKVLDNSLGKK